MRPKIKITITDRRGKKGCHRGHHVGEVFDFDEDRGKICPMAMHCAFPYIDILRYGGTIPGQEKGKAEFCCSDAGTIMVFEAEIVEKKKTSGTRPTKHKAIQEEGQHQMKVLPLLPIPIHFLPRRSASSTMRFFQLDDRGALLHRTSRIASSMTS